MFCPNCGTKLEENAAYCTTCGAAARSDNSDQPAQSSFPDPTVLPTPEQGRIDPKQLTPSPQQEQDIDIDSVVSSISEPEPDTPTEDAADENMAWFTDHQSSDLPTPVAPPQPNPQARQADTVQPSAPWQTPSPTPPPASPSYFAQAPAVDRTPRKSNVFMGLIGAVVFSLIGCVIWVIIGSFGLVSYLGALAMSFLTITGYKLLGRKFDGFGILICLIVVALAVLASNIFTIVLSIAADEELMEFMSALGYNGFKDLFLNFFDMMKRIDLILEAYAPGEGTMAQEFIFGLVISYIFAGIAFIAVAVPQYKASKNS